MNYIDGVVKKVLKEEVKTSSEMWDLKDGEEDKTHYMYCIEAIDEGGLFETRLCFDEPTEIKEGYRFKH